MTGLNLRAPYVNNIFNGNALTISLEVACGLLLDLVNEAYDYLLIDLAGITYGLKASVAFLINVRLVINYGYLKPSVIFVVNYSRAQGCG
ncbi:hypothetical protein [Vulcanisaeta souniana]|uniref:hypothetical protein n=1 Tax=Vulcanisaeta souniana TaxID=164452 RepID=UPI0016650974|nr:hypothetical protein [Vulcanisaeta souniana]